MSCSSAVATVTLAPHAPNWTDDPLRDASGDAYAAKLAGRRAFNLS